MKVAMNRKLQGMILAPWPPVRIVEVSVIVGVHCWKFYYILHNSEGTV